MMRYDKDSFGNETYLLTWILYPQFGKGRSHVKNVKIGFNETKRWFSLNVWQFVGAWYTQSSTSYVYRDGMWGSITNSLYAWKDGTITNAFSGMKWVGSHLFSLHYYKESILYQITLTYLLFHGKLRILLRRLLSNI